MSWMKYYLNELAEELDCEFDTLLDGSIAIPPDLEQRIAQRVQLKRETMEAEFNLEQANNERN